ncbi:hypothetical protein [Streptomyces sp. KLMMK]|uniref:hypothetical protein n=1 Tax=Streptomyces sp. KLMMK TaxID=3109353 RepID=UPI00300A1753
METAPRVMASYLLTKLEPITLTEGVLDDRSEQEQLQCLVEYLIAPQSPAPFTPAGTKTSNATECPGVNVKTTTPPHGLDDDTHGAARLDDETFD